MPNTPSDLRYTREHEWARKDDDGRLSVGITDYAQDQLGDIVYIQLPAQGADVTAGDPMGEVESTKSVSDIYSPVSGKVAEVNAEVIENPEGVNQDPYGEGWLVVIEPSDATEFDGLMTSEEYELFLVEEGGEEVG
jgi:glycine cleavage system H protein